MIIFYIGKKQSMNQILVKKFIRKIHINEKNAVKFKMEMAKLWMVSHAEKIDQQTKLT